MQALIIILMMMAYFKEITYFMDNFVQRLYSEDSYGTYVPMRASQFSVLSQCLIWIANFQILIVVFELALSGMGSYFHLIIILQFINLLIFANRMLVIHFRILSCNYFRSEMK
jgi:hypothetical protein